MTTERWRLREGPWAQIADGAGPLRRRVFVDEQGVPPELEWDAHDLASVHFLIENAATGEAVATARLLPDGHVGRMAVDRRHRRQGLGRILMEAIRERALTDGHPRLVLAAQTHAIPFYEALGFTAYGDEFEDAGLPHRMMARDL